MWCDVVQVPGLRLESMYSSRGVLRALFSDGMLIWWTGEQCKHNRLEIRVPKKLVQKVNFQ